MTTIMEFGPEQIREVAKALRFYKRAWADSDTSRSWEKQDGLRELIKRFDAAEEGLPT